MFRLTTEMTRNIYTNTDKNIKTKENNKLSNWIHYNHSSYGTPKYPAIPINNSAPPNKMSRDTFCKDSIDIESNLLGINNNFDTSRYKSTCGGGPLNKCQSICSVKFFENNKIVMPEELIIPGNQRLFPI
tara:strand:- start:65 stop:454 length:390 start_codon:yes stop_codon:yes gene_type:complete